MGTIKFKLWKIRLSKDGYDNIGEYWGTDGGPLYCYYPNEDLIPEIELCEHVRAATREIAKAKIRERFPTAIFYN